MYNKSILPETVCYWCVLLYIHRKIQKILIFAAHLSDSERHRCNSSVVTLTESVRLSLLFCDRTATHSHLHTLSQSLKCLFDWMAFVSAPCIALVFCRGCSGEPVSLLALKKRWGQNLRRPWRKPGGQSSSEALTDSLFFFFFPCLSAPLQRANPLFRLIQVRSLVRAPANPLPDSTNYLSNKLTV